LCPLQGTIDIISAGGCHETVDTFTAVCPVLFPAC
jgi:hypothetical protein